MRKPLRRPRFSLMVSSETWLVVLNEHSPPVNAKLIDMQKSQEKHANKPGMERGDKTQTKEKTDQASLSKGYRESKTQCGKDERRSRT